MEMRKWLSILVLLFGALVFAQEAEFDMANQACMEGRYADALDLYSSLKKVGWEDAALYYNMGNCYYELGQLGEAIQYYEKALVLEPQDEDILHNLAFANRKTVDRIEELPQPFLRSLLIGTAGWMSSRGWALLFLAVWFVSMILLVFYVLIETVRRRSFFLSGIALLPIALIFMALMFVQKKEEGRSFGVVIELNSYVKDGPGDASDDLFILHEGTKAEILDDYEGWMKIKLSDGKIGWISAESMGMI